jgi:hypothetical protein
MIEKKVVLLYDKKQVNFQSIVKKL